MTLTELGSAMADVPDDVLFARLRAVGFVVGESHDDPMDRDQIEAAANHEDWWDTQGRGK